MGLHSCILPYDRGVRSGRRHERVIIAVTPCAIQVPRAPMSVHRPCPDLETPERTTENKTDSRRVIVIRPPVVIPVSDDDAVSRTDGGIRIQDGAPVMAARARITGIPHPPVDKERCRCGRSDETRRDYALVDRVDRDKRIAADRIEAEMIISRSRSEAERGGVRGRDGMNEFDSARAADSPRGVLVIIRKPVRDPSVHEAIVRVLRE